MMFALVYYNKGFLQFTKYFLYFTKSQCSFVVYIKHLYSL